MILAPQFWRTGVAVPLAAAADAGEIDAVIRSENISDIRKGKCSRAKSQRSALDEFAPGQSTGPGRVEITYFFHVWVTLVPDVFQRNPGFGNTPNG